MYPSKPAPMGAQKSTVVQGKEGSARGRADFDRGILTRKLCTRGLCISGFLAIACLIIGAASFQKAQRESQGWIPLKMPRALKEIIPLLINVVVTILTESSGFIHATALRWALGNDLTFTSNLRLFSRVQGRFAFERMSNFLNAGFLILSYCATSLIFASRPPPNICNHSQLTGAACNYMLSDVYFCPGALIALGIGLVGNTALTTWQLSTITIPTWSSSPIDIAWASLSIGQRCREENRCMVSVHESTSITVPRKPETQQRSAWSAHREVRRVLIYLWILVILALAWFSSLAGAINHFSPKCFNESSHTCSVYSGSSWSLLPDAGGTTSLAQINTVDRWGDSNLSENGGFALAFLIILGFQSTVTMGLHCAELLVNLSRDEDIWRETYSAEGYVRRNALTAVLRSWKTVLLLVLKPIVHWLFGLGMTFYYGWGVFMRPPQLLYMSIAIIVTATLGTFVCFARPKGPQPAAFGHVQTLVNLIDDWGEHLFWGHKRRGIDGICHAGTANFELQKIIMTEEYAAG